MHATIRRYEGVDAARTNEVVERVNETLVPQLRELAGFSGYYLIDAGNGVISSISLFETSEQAEESDEARRGVDHRREPRHGDSQRPRSSQAARSLLIATAWSPSPSSSVHHAT